MYDWDFGYSLQLWDKDDGNFYFSGGQVGGTYADFDYFRFNHNAQDIEMYVNISDSTGGETWNPTLRILYTTFANLGFPAIDYSGAQNTNAALSFDTNKNTYLAGVLADQSGFTSFDSNNHTANYSDGSVIADFINAELFYPGSTSVMMQWSSSNGVAFPNGIKSWTSPTTTIDPNYGLLFAQSGAPLVDFNTNLSFPNGVYSNTYGTVTLSTEIAHLYSSVGAVVLDFSSQQSGSGSTVMGYTRNSSVNAVFAESTFQGNSASGTAYTITDIVTALKNYGLLAP